MSKVMITALVCSVQEKCAPAQNTVSFLFWKKTL